MFTHPYLLFIDKTVCFERQHKNLHDKLLYPFTNILLLSKAKAQWIKTLLYKCRSLYFIANSKVECLRIPNYSLCHKQLPKSAYLWHCKLTFSKIRGGETAIQVDKSYHKGSYTSR